MYTFDCLFSSPEPKRLQSFMHVIDYAHCAARSTPRNERKVAIVLFNFPPNSGAMGTAAHLSVFESLFIFIMVCAGEQWRHGWVSAMETWACAGWVLASNGGLCVCLLFVDQHWRCGCVLGSC